ncbi:MAG: Biopolymer transport protein ExbD [Myxococcota bacterium]|nr:Biopolymer transport protein ExbD [Myxococcota bacterium]
MRPDQKLRPEINVTPLVDVVLVLLIIFMVIMPQMEQGPDVRIPGILNPDQESKSKLDPLMVSVTAQGQLYLEKDPLERGVLLERLKALHEREPSRKVVIKADRDARYAAVREVFKDCRDLGFPGVSLKVGDKPKQAAGG